MQRAFHFFLHDFFAVDALYDEIIIQRDRRRIFHTRITQGIVSRCIPHTLGGVRPLNFCAPRREKIKTARCESRDWRVWSRETKVISLRCERDVYYPFYHAWIRYFPRAIRSHNHRDYFYKLSEYDGVIVIYWIIIVVVIAATVVVLQKQDRYFSWIL